MTLTAWKVAPALAAGCTVVVKPSEHSPLSMLRLGALALEAGLPDGVLNVVTGDGPAVPTLLGRHRDVDSVAFTGSTAVGRQFMHYAADSNLKRVWLELGGKSPSIVLPGRRSRAAARPPRATSSSTRARCAPPRPGCWCTPRCATRSSAGSSTSPGRCASAIRWTRPRRWARWSAAPTANASTSTSRHAVAAGAAMRAGGTRPDSGGFYYRPTVLDGVSPHMAIARDEVFGPVLSVLEFDTVEQATNWPTTPTTAWPRPSGPATSATPTASRERSRPGPSG